TWRAAPSFDGPEGRTYNPPTLGLLATAHAGGPGVRPFPESPSVNPKPSYVTREGMEKLRQELDSMIDVRRPEVAARIQEAKAHGDLSENAEYEDAKNEQAFVEGRIQSLEALIKNAIIIDEHHATDHVSIGSTVALKSDD